MKILLVDDDATLLDLVGYALGRKGHRVVTAADGTQALALCRAERPDLVLLDVTLPEVDGFEVCRQIRQESHTPVILLTGRREDADVVQGLDAGADDYVTRPVSLRVLTARMNAVLRRYRQGDTEAENRPWSARATSSWTRRRTASPRGTSRCC
jgi:DNA-binding response OmpR family regulator